MKKCVGTIVALLLPAAATAQTDDSDFSVGSPTAVSTQKPAKPAASAKQSPPAAPADDSESDFVSSSASPSAASPPVDREANPRTAPVADKAADDSDFTPSQPSSPVASIAAVATGPAPRTLPKGTTVTFTINAALGSKVSAIDQPFPISLSQPITLPDGVVIPAGITGMGEVVHAAKAGFAGKAGELILAVRYLTCGTTKIPLGKFRYGAVGENRTGEVFAASMVFAPAAFMMAGGEIDVPTGTVGTARTTADVQLPETTGGACAG